MNLGLTEPKEKFIAGLSKPADLLQNSVFDYK